MCTLEPDLWYFRRGGLRSTAGAILVSLYPLGTMHRVEGLVGLKHPGLEPRQIGGHVVEPAPVALSTGRQLECNVLLDRRAR